MKTVALEVWLAVPHEAIARCQHIIPAVVGSNRKRDGDYPRQCRRAALRGTATCGTHQLNKQGTTRT